jgi:hypothetical protein
MGILTRTVSRFGLVRSRFCRLAVPNGTCLEASKKVETPSHSLSFLMIGESDLSQCVFQIAAKIGGMLLLDVGIVAIPNFQALR